jgi:hypothetical protein
MVRLDRFILKKNFMTLFFKTVKASFNHSKTGQIVLFSNGRPFCYHLKTGPKYPPENDHLKTGRSGFRMLTVYGQNQSLAKRAK